MARFWALMTFAVTVLLSSLAAMTEDRPRPEGGLPALGTIIPPPTPLPLPALLDDAAGRRSYERRHQRQPAGDASSPSNKLQGATEPSTFTTGSVILASLTTTSAPRPSELGPVMPVRIVLQAGDEVARKTGVRKPLAKSPTREQLRAPLHRPDIVTAAILRPEAEPQTMPPRSTDAEGEPPKLAKPGAGDARDADAAKRDRASRKVAASREPSSQTATRRPADRHASVKQESLWSRAQRDGS